MNSDQFLALSPVIVLGLAAMAVTLAISFRRSHKLAFGLALSGLAIAFACLPWSANESPLPVGNLLRFDFFAAYYMGLIIVAALITSILAYNYLRLQNEIPEEYYILLLLATAGACTLAAACHFATLFLGLETLSVALYAMIGYTRDRHISIEAAAKYLILAAMSSAFLIFGMALVYAETGQLEFGGMARAADAITAAAGLTLMLSLGVGMIAVAAGFKLAVAPFHAWTPDVYEGAPAPTTAFIATVSKGAMVALLLRFFALTAFPGAYPVFLALALVAAVSMLLGNVLALRQTNVKRILAYSSIAHLGYLLTAFLAAGELSSFAVTFYITAYMITALGAFGIITVLSTGGRDAGTLDDFHALAWKRPWLAAAFSATLLSLAGIPLTAGFIGKFYVVAAGAQSEIWGLLFTLALGSVISVYYYLRVIVAMFQPLEPAEAPHEMGATRSITVLACVALVALMAGLLWLGIAPSPLANIIQVALTASQ